MSLHWLPTLISLVVLALAAASARAEDSTATTTEYKLDDTQVDGALQAPHGEVLIVRKREARESLIRVREHWVHELLHSVENL